VAEEGRREKKRLRALNLVTGLETNKIGGVQKYQKKKDGRTDTILPSHRYFHFPLRRIIAWCEGRAYWVPHQVAGTKGVLMGPYANHFGGEYLS